MFTPSCLPVLIGSLPLFSHLEAMEIILTYSPEIPLWPQLPKRPREGMIRQFISGLPCLADEDDKYFLRTKDNHFVDEMAAFYEDYLQITNEEVVPDSSRFALGLDTAPGFLTFIDTLTKNDVHPISVKGQITGPMTTGIGVRDQRGNSIFYDDNLRDIVVKLLSLKARWQVEKLLPFTNEVPPLIFIDEPGIVSFGSTAYTSVTREMVGDAVEEVIASIRLAGGLAGVHICANGDWTPVLSSRADIISFDAYSFFKNFILYEEQLFNYIARGGILAWGIVPTGDPLAIQNESAESLFVKWEYQVKELAAKGMNESKLMAQMLIAPSCGTGSLSPELAIKVLSLTHELSGKIRKQLRIDHEQ